MKFRGVVGDVAKNITWLVSRASLSGLPASSLRRGSCMKKMDREHEADKKLAQGVTRKVHYCSSCRMHDSILVPMRGHKKVCKWKDCKCSVCGLSEERRLVMRGLKYLERNGKANGTGPFQQEGLAGEEDQEISPPQLAINRNGRPDCCGKLIHCKECLLYLNS